MRFTLRTMLLVFVFVSSALAAFGAPGLLVAAILAAIAICVRAAHTATGAAASFLMVGMLMLAGLFLVGTLATGLSTPPESAGVGSWRHVLALAVLVLSYLALVQRAMPENGRD